MAWLFTLKEVIAKLIKLIPTFPDQAPVSEESQLLDSALREIMHNAEVNGVEPENFITFTETLRKMTVFLMEQDGYYRKYVGMFFDIIRQKWKP